jgi:CubicO group peptidase (beta-lactamase class C family)
MLASVGKVFTAAAVGKLLDQGVIASLDEDICKVFSSSSTTTMCRHPAHSGTTVTWRMLVTHRSGLPENLPTVTINGAEEEATYGPDEHGYGNPICPLPICPLTNVQDFYRAVFTPNGTTTVGGGSIDWYKEAEGGWVTGVVPGSQFSYSNMAYGYIPALIEKLIVGSGSSSFEQFCQAHLFGPLGMTRTSWFRESLPAGTSVAVPLDEDFATLGHYCFIDYGSGQLYSTANDLAKFLSSILRRGVGDLWQSNVGNLLFACQEQTTNGQLVANSSCTTGLGWELVNEKAFAELDWLESFVTYDTTGGAMHDGAELGIAAQVLVLPNAQVYIAVMTNTEEGAAEEVAAAVAKMALGSGTDAGPPPSGGGGLLILLAAVLAFLTSCFL